MNKQSKMCRIYFEVERERNTDINIFWKHTFHLNLGNITYLKLKFTISMNIDMLYIYIINQDKCSSYSSTSYKTHSYNSWVTQQPLSLNQLDLQCHNQNNIKLWSSQWYSYKQFMHRYFVAKMVLILNMSGFKY